MSIANNIDYGVLSRIILSLEQPSDLEVMLMSTVRLYHMVTKVSSKDGKVGLKSIPRVTIPHRFKKTSQLPAGASYLVDKAPMRLKGQYLQTERPSLLGSV